MKMKSRDEKGRDEQVEIQQWCTQKDSRTSLKNTFREYAGINECANNE